MSETIRTSARALGAALVGTSLLLAGCQGLPLPSAPPLFGSADGTPANAPAPAYADAPVVADAPVYAGEPGTVVSAETAAVPADMGVAPGRPPDAAPGQVWCYVHVPPVYETQTERVCIRQAETRRIWVPPVTQVVEEQVMVEPERRIRVQVPAQFADQQRQMQVQPGRLEWQKVECQGAELKPAESIGGCWTLAELPPIYEMRTERICTQPEAWREEVVPARYEMRRKTVEVQPGRWREEQDPAQYETRTREVQISAARWEWRRNDVCEVPGAMTVVPDGGPAPSAGSGAPVLTRPAGGGDLERAWGFEGAGQTPAPVVQQPWPVQPVSPASPSGGEASTGGMSSDELVPPSGEMFVDPRAVQTQPPPSVYGDTPPSRTVPAPAPAPAPANQWPAPAPAPTNVPRPQARPPVVQPPVVQPPVVQPPVVTPSQNQPPVVPPNELPPIPTFDD